eukprot:1301341-Rhodomonas_salina.2
MSKISTTHGRAVQNTHVVEHTTRTTTTGLAERYKALAKPVPATAERTGSVGLKEAFEHLRVRPYKLLRAPGTSIPDLSTAHCAPGTSLPDVSTAHRAPLPAVSTAYRVWYRSAISAQFELGTKSRV